MSEQALSCQELVELVTNYLENALSSADRIRFEEHLADCTGCQHYLEQMRKTIMLVGRLTEATIEEPVKQSLLDLFRDWKAAR